MVNSELLMKQSKDRMGMKRRVMVIWLVLGLLVGGGCAPVVGPAAGRSEPGAAEMTPVKLGVGYIPNVQFAPFYVGIDQGFFAAEGIELSLDYGFENDYLKLVGTNDFQFMIGSGDQVVLGQAQGLPVRYVMSWYAKYPVVIFAKREAGISQPADLAGKKIGIPGPFGANYVALRGILEAAGLQESDVKLESIGFTQAAAVSEGLVDAAVDYGVNGPVVLAQSGIETTQIALDPLLRIPANGLVTNEITISENPELVRRMVRAMSKAIQFTLDNPDESFAIALKHVPEAGGENEPANRAVFDAVLDYWRPLPERKLGETTLEEWSATAALMQRIGLVEPLVPAEKLFTNEFLP
jgi:NitT/TauT family transport system substrate-binding protein